MFLFPPQTAKMNHVKVLLRLQFPLGNFLRTVSRGLVLRTAFRIDVFLDLAWRRSVLVFLCPVRCFFLILLLVVCSFTRTVENKLNLCGVLT